MFDNIFEKPGLIRGIIERPGIIGPGIRGIVSALEDCYKANCRPAYMPELVRKRIAEDLSEPIWTHSWTSASLIASGRTKQGSHVKIVAHIPHAFLEPAILKDVFDNNKLINGAGEYPKEDFKRKVALAEKGEAGVYLIPKERLKGFKLGLYSLDSALEHPLAIPIMGVSESEAKKYLSKHREKFGPAELGIWYDNDFAKKTLGRLVFLGSHDGGLGGCDLHGDYDLDYNARLFGVSRASEASTEAPVGRVQKSSTTPYREQGTVAVPTLEEVIAVIKKESEDCVPSLIQKQYEGKLRGSLEKLGLK